MQILQVVSDTDRRGARCSPPTSRPSPRRGATPSTPSPSPRDGPRPGRRDPVRPVAVGHGAAGAPGPDGRSRRDRGPRVEHGPGLRAPGLGPGRPFVYRQISDTRFWAPTRVKRARVRATLSRAETVVALSEFNRRELVEWIGLPADRIVVIPNGVPSVRFPPADAAPRAGRPSRPGPRRRAGGAVRGRARAREGGRHRGALVAERPDAHLVIAGAGPDARPDRASGRPSGARARTRRQQRRRRAPLPRGRPAGAPEPRGRRHARGPHRSRPVRAPGGDHPTSGRSPRWCVTTRPGSWSRRVTSARSPRRSARSSTTRLLERRWGRPLAHTASPTSTSCRWPTAGRPCSCPWPGGRPNLRRATQRERDALPAGHRRVAVEHPTNDRPLVEALAGPIAATPAPHAPAGRDPRARRAPPRSPRGRAPGRACRSRRPPRSPGSPGCRSPRRAGPWPRPPSPRGGSPRGATGARRRRTRRAARRRRRGGRGTAPRVPVLRPRGRGRQRVGLLGIVAAHAHEHEALGIEPLHGLEELGVPLLAYQPADGADQHLVVGHPEPGPHRARVARR